LYNIYRKKGKHAGVVCGFMVAFVKGGKVKKGRIITDGETIKVEHARLCKAPSC